MSLDARMTIEAGVATLVLAGEADAESAPELHRLVTDATRSSLRQLTLDLTGLTYLSSTGLRCLVYAHQRLGRGVRIVLVGANDEVAETIRLTGFDRQLLKQPRCGFDIGLHRLVVRHIRDGRCYACVLDHGEGSWGTVVRSAGRTGGGSGAGGGRGQSIAIRLSRSPIVRCASIGCRRGSLLWTR